MSVRVSFDIENIPELTFYLKNIDRTLGNETSEGLAYAVDTQLLPDLAEASTTVWDVRTGNYYTHWYRQVISSTAVMVDNEMLYSRPLEYGWTMRNGAFRESPGVLLPTVASNIDSMARALLSWIKLTLIR